MADLKGVVSRKLSLRIRLTIWVVAIFALIQVITGLGYFSYQYRVAWSGFDSQLSASAQAVADAIDGRLPSVAAVELERIARSELGEIQADRFVVDIVGQDGRSLVADGPLSVEAARSILNQFQGSGKPQRLRLSSDAALTEELGHRRAEVLALPLGVAPGQRTWLVIATSDTSVRREMAVVARVLVVGGVFGLLASGVSGWLISRVAVDPFQTLSQAADQLNPASIEREIMVDSQSPEVAKVVAELEAARKRIRSAFESQERFLSNISHEIKTPIATLLLEVQTTSRDQMTEQGLEFMDTVEEEMRKLGSLVESFLTLTRVRNQNTVEHAKRYAANEIVMDSVADCSIMAEQYSVKVAPELASDEAGLDAELFGDPDLLRTLLNNLIRNAIRFSPRNETVSVTASAGSGWFTVKVRDRGVGLPEEVIDRVFDRFAQAPDETLRKRGHGLGLAIAKGIAELHLGDLTVRNHPEGGAEFTAELPIARLPS